MKESSAVCGRLALAQSVDYVVLDEIGKYQV